MRSSFFGLLLAVFTPMFAQPNTDIFLFELDGGSLRNPINLSNNPGYDNQPSFWEDSESVLYARTVNGQTEIARYYLKTGQTEIITSTLQGSEYSPTQIPGTQAISSIRLDTTGLQLLYRYERNGQSTVLIPDLKIGYHVWINPQELAVFVLGDPVSLQVLRPQDGTSSYIDEQIGRSLHPFPLADGFSFVSKKTEPWRIFLYQMDKKFKDGLIDLPPNVEDYCWSPDGRKIYTSNGSNLLVTNEGQPWEKVADLQSLGLTGTISRMAISPNGKWMAVVIEKNNDE